MRMPGRKLAPPTWGGAQDQGGTSRPARCADPNTPLLTTSHYPNPPRLTSPWSPLRVAGLPTAGAPAVCPISAILAPASPPVGVIPQRAPIVRSRFVSPEVGHLVVPSPPLPLLDDAATARTQCHLRRVWTCHHQSPVHPRFLHRSNTWTETCLKIWNPLHPGARTWQAFDLPHRCNHSSTKSNPQPTGRVGVTVGLGCKVLEFGWV